jgi:NAD(P)H dehydrogenase (quinone)
MQDLNILIVFCSHTGWTEKLALAEAVGAVQGRANIRLRHARTQTEDKTVESEPGWKEHRDRMSQEYIAPRETDLEWADAVIAGTPARVGAASGEWAEFLHLLEMVGSCGKLEGKVGTAFTGASRDGAENESTLGTLCGAMAKRGLTVVLPGELDSRDVSEAAALQAVRLQARRVAAITRALKSANCLTRDTATATC